MRALLPLLALALAAAAFDPRAYEQHFRTAHCPASSSSNATASLALHYADLNPAASKTLLLVHGWPSLWASWKHQIAALGADYRLLVPELRGFGASAAPPDVRAGTTMPDLAADMACILRHAGVAQAVCIGCASPPPASASAQRSRSRQP
jgi:soluble epoxide hydrolase/lipid-phosphate phosphatase